MKSIGVILFFIAISSPGLFTLYLSAPAIFMSQYAKFWDKEIATVESVELVASKGRHSHSSKVVYINYTYTIENKTYGGSKIGFGYGLNNIENHEGIFDALKYAKKIAIYVNPFDEENSVITTGLNNSTIGLFIFSLMWNGLIGAAIMSYSFKDDKRKKNELFN